METKGQTVTVTVNNELTRDKGSLTIAKEFNPQASGYTGTFDINYTCVDGADKVKEGTVSLAAGKSETISGLPTGTVCTVTEPKLPANPSGWTFNPPTFTPANGQATVTTKGQRQRHRDELGGAGQPGRGQEDLPDRGDAEQAAAEEGREPDPDQQDQDQEVLLRLAQARGASPADRQQRRR